MVSFTQDIIGCWKKKKITKHCLNIVARNIYSYYRVLNSPSGMVQINYYNHLDSVLDSIQYEKDCDKEEGKPKKREAEAQNTAKKAASLGNEEKNKHELMPGT